MRLGESNIRHFEDSDLQILGFRCSKIENVKGVEVQQDAEKARCFAEIAQVAFPWTEDCFFSQATCYPQTTVHLLRIKPT